MNPSERVEAFLLEWRMRETLMLFNNATKCEIAAHRKEILHNWCLTEEDIKAYEAVEQGFEGVE